jgi:hypothetical protein
VLEPTSESWPLAQKVEGRKKKKFKKNGNCPTGPSVNRRPAGDRWSGSGHPAATATRPRPLVTGSPTTRGRHPRVDTCACGTIHIFLKFFNLKNNNFGSLGDGPGLLGEWVYSTPIF